MKNLDISAITDRNPLECYVVVFDSAMNHIGTYKPGGSKPEEPTKSAPAPPASLNYEVSAEFKDGKIYVAATPDTDCLIKIIGITPVTRDRVFAVPDYQVAEGVTFTVQAIWAVPGSLVQKETTVTARPQTVKAPRPVDAPAVDLPPAKVLIAVSECVGNRQIFDPAVDFNREGKTRIRNRNNPENIYYWIAGGVPARELTTEYIYAPGDQVSIYAAITNDPDPFTGNFQPAFSIVTIPENVQSNS